MIPPVVLDLCVVLGHQSYSMQTRRLTTEWAMWEGSGPVHRRQFVALDLYRQEEMSRCDIDEYIISGPKWGALEMSLSRVDSRLRVGDFHPQHVMSKKGHISN